VPIRTGVSEDPKGDPGKILPSQPEPGPRESEPLIRREKHPRPAEVHPGAQTPADREGLRSRPPTK
jgi:hypothetical protein